MRYLAACCEVFLKAFLSTRTKGLLTSKVGSSSSKQQQKIEEETTYRELIVTAKSLAGTLGSFAVKFKRISKALGVLQFACCTVIGHSKLANCILDAFCC